MSFQIAKFAGPAALALAVAACQQEAPASEPVTPENTVLIPPVLPLAETDSGAPSLTAEAEKGEEGARNVLLAWARAIEFERFDEAWNLFGDAARERMDEAGFAKTFEGLSDITVIVPGGEMEGAAGSLFYTSQATITAEDSSGRPVRLEGPVVLRRVNDVPGASEDQLRWHIESAELARTH